MMIQAFEKYAGWQVELISEMNDIGEIGLLMKETKIPRRGG